MAAQAGPVAVMRSAASALLSRFDIMRRAGITFEGARDLFTALGYKKDLGVEDYIGRYKRNGVARRVVRSVPAATWRGGIELVEDENPSTVTEFEDAWDELATRLAIWSVLKRADILAGLGRYAVVLIGAPGDPASELGRSTPEQIGYLQPYSEDKARIKTLVTDPANERFGQAETYEITTLAGAPDRTKTVTVHWSRVLHVADDCLESDVYGTPRLEAVWNNIDDLEKVAGGGSEAFWLRAHQGFQFDVKPDVKMTPQAEQDLADEVEEYLHQMRRAIRTRGVDVKPLGADVASITGNVDSLISLIAAGSEIPQRILMGSERGELASTQDSENWNTRINDRRKDHAGPMIVRPFADRLIERGILPEPAEYNVRWPSVQDLSDTERGELANLWATINSSAGGVVVTPDEIRDRILQLDPLTEAQKAEAEAAAADAAAAEEGEDPDAEEPAVPEARLTRRALIRYRKARHHVTKRRAARS